MLEGPEGQCPSCGNSYLFLNGLDEGPKGFSAFERMEWEYGGEVFQPKSFKVLKNSKPDKCPKCAVAFEELITWSDKFCVIRKKCLRCGITDSEIIRKESQNA